jgi:3-hydroxyethyl bacteriochlorophyllide a dehydrogenase
MNATTTAVVLEKPGHLALHDLDLAEPQDGDVVVDIEWSGISTGTERLLYTGAMPTFPGMGYPLVPGYESVGRVRSAGPESGHEIGERVFVPGARCFGDVRSLRLQGQRRPRRTRRVAGARGHRLPRGGGRWAARPDRAA